MAEARSYYNYYSDYVESMDYFINYYANYNNDMKEFDFYSLFNSNSIQNHNCYITIKIDRSLTLYFIKEGINDTPIGVERFYNSTNWDTIGAMARVTEQIVLEFTEGKVDITDIYNSTIETNERDRSHQASGWDNYPVSSQPLAVVAAVDSWGPPPLAGIVRSTPTIAYDTPDEPDEIVFSTYITPDEPDEIVFSTGMEINRQLNFDIDDMTNQIIDEIRNTNIVKCPLCRTENARDDCVNIKGSGDTCSICLDKHVEIFFIGCGHAATCRSCFEQL